MHWMELLPLIALASAILVVPGAAFGVALGLRGASVLLRAPLFSVGMAGVSAVVCGVAGLRWSLVSFFALAAIFTVLAGVASRIVLRHFHGEREAVLKGPAVWWGLAGATASGIILARALKSALINPDAISQSYDNIFHLNAIRYIADTGNGSSLTLLSMTSADGAGGFYPAAWHDIVSLIFSAFPNSIPASTNAATFAVAVLAWPLSVVALAVSLRPGVRVHALAAGILSAAFIGFPGIVLKWGVLYPNMLGLAVFPAYIAIVRSAFRDIEQGRRSRWWIDVSQVLVGTAAVALAHPNVLVSAVAILLPWMVSLTWGSASAWWRGRSVPVFRVGVLVAGCCGAVAAWLVLRPGAENATWGPSLPSGQAAGEFALQSFNGNRAQWLVASLVLLGICIAFRRRQGRWLVAGWLMTGFLWVVATSWEIGPVRTLITGPWYNDKYRLAAITVVPALFLAASGVSAVVEMMRSRWGRSKMFRPRTFEPILFFAFTAVLAVSATVTRGMDEAWRSVAHEFMETPDSLLVTTHEQAVFSAMDRYVPASDVVVVDPWEGSALAYALEDRQVTQRHSLSDTPAEYAPIVKYLDDPARVADVCRAVERTRAHWYLDFDDTLDIGKDFRGQYEGLDDAVSSGALTPVYTSGPVGLYRISECDAR